MAEHSKVTSALADRVAMLTIDHPPVNALNRAVMHDLAAALAAALADDRVKVIVIAGAGADGAAPSSVFVAGADIAEMAAAGAAEIEAFILLGKAVFDRIERSPKPVIAAIHGLALGGGLELALACHLRIVGEHVRLGLPEVNLGLIPGWGGTQRLPRIVGVGKALELILTGDAIDAGEAHRIGLANRVVPRDQVLAEAMALANRLAAKSRLTHRATLAAIWGGVYESPAVGQQLETDQFRALVGSDDAKEGISAFLGKRKANFEDR